MRPLILLALFIAISTSTIADERPNILVILSDDMGYSDIGCYGGEIKTPNLDGLARKGVRFTQFYNTGRCCPTRGSLLTGLYPHQSGIGHMTSDYGIPSYRGELNRQCLTLAEAAKLAGYRTYMAGKWHVTPYNGNKPANPDRSNWPLQRGFDRFFGTIHGAGSFFDPNSLTRDNEFITPETNPDYHPEEFYYTDAISDHSVLYIRDHAENHEEKPFLHYVAYTAAHWPMHALPEDIAKYEGKYDDGYAPVREARLKKLKRLGLRFEQWEPAPLVGNWDKVELKEWESACMEVYAAMIDNMDQGIGRIVSALKETGQYENTLILFMQDNGGCAETFGRDERVGPLERPDKPTLPPMNADEIQTEMIPSQSRDGYPLRRGAGVMPGFPETQLGYGINWANVSNTPFREYKHYVHEGGIATPLIAHWPAGIAKTGEEFRSTKQGNLHDAPTHLIDIMATLVDLGKVEYPLVKGDEKITPLEGISLKPALRGKAIQREHPIFFEHEGNRAVRDGKWKLVAKGVKGDWELYDMESDRAEMNNVIESHREVADQLIAEYDEWATRAGVVPFRSWKIKGSSEKHFSLKPGDALYGPEAPAIANRGFTLTATISGDSAEGVIVCQGGSSIGWSLFVAKDRVQFWVRNHGNLQTLSAGFDPARKNQIEIKVAQKEATLSLNGKVAVTLDQKAFLKEQPQDGLDVGLDKGGMVGPYDAKNEFPGTIHSLELNLE
ncbi:arylsulfatase [Verrucomicrobiales bacterium BCK34]|nr:arylsulfatase [Verrucomicrobiales bacterium BCK34]